MEKKEIIKFHEIILTDFKYRNILILWYINPEKNWKFSCMKYSNKKFVLC